METAFWTAKRGCLQMGSYRTYEEWKHFCELRLKSAFLCSYRTYEEWKQGKHLACEQACLIVLTVPMRNGNQQQ